MSTRFRKLALTVHVVLSAGWFGAVIAYLALAIVGLTGGDAQKVRAAYVSLEVIGWFVIVPLAVGTLLAGLLESLITAWGLFRYWWVAVKFVLTLGATAVLLQHMPSVTQMSRIAAETTLTDGDSLELRVQLIVHAGGGLLVLLAAMVLSVFKPWGLTPYGMRTHREPRRTLATEVSTPSEITGAAAIAGARNKTPRWALVVGIHAIGLVLLFLVVHIALGGMSHH